MPSKTFSRSHFEEIESEIVWSTALKEYQRANSWRTFYILFLASFTILLLSNQSYHPSNKWIRRGLAACRGPETNYIALDLVTRSHMPFPTQHTVTTAMMDTANIEAVKDMPFQYRLHCYGQRMYHTHAQINKFYECADAMRVPWSAAWEPLGEQANTIAGVIFGLVSASVTLISTRVLFRSQ